MDILDSIGNELYAGSHSEIISISSVAIFKMLRHARAGIPIEVMGLILGKIGSPVEISIEDVFAMPQTGTGVSVEAIDPVFQTKMLDMLSQVGKNSNIVGWYHSHPGFGCWLSGVDINTQQSFEQLNKRSIAIVIDPVLSVSGKIIIEAFRNYPPFLRNQDSRETNSVESLIMNHTLTKDDHGINKYYYGITISFSKSIIEDSLLISALNWKNDQKIYRKQDKIFRDSKIDKKILKLSNSLQQKKTYTEFFKKQFKEFPEKNSEQFFTRLEKVLNYFLSLAFSLFLDSKF